MSDEQAKAKSRELAYRQAGRAVVAVYVQKRGSGLRQNMLQRLPSGDDAGFFAIAGIIAQKMAEGTFPEAGSDRDYYDAVQRPEITIVRDENPFFTKADDGPSDKTVKETARLAIRTRDILKERWPTVERCVKALLEGADPMRGLTELASEGL